MQVLAADYGAGNVRLVVWFDNSNSAPESARDKGRKEGQDTLTPDQALVQRLHDQVGRGTLISSVHGIRPRVAGSLMRRGS